MKEQVDLPMSLRMSGMLSFTKTELLESINLRDLMFTVFHITKKLESIGLLNLRAGELIRVL